jgi:hypothetical protein
MVRIAAETFGGSRTATELVRKKPGDAQRDGLVRIDEVLGNVNQASLGCRAVYKSGGTMRFRPKIQASIDQVPGPIIAKVAPRTARKRGRVVLAGDRKARLASRMAITVPAIGVHKPAISKTPATAPILCGTTAAQIGFAIAHATPQ